MTVLFEIVHHLFLLAAMIYCLFVLTFGIGRPLIDFHEYWFVRDAVRFVRCPSCGAAKFHDGLSSLILLLSPSPPVGAFGYRMFGRLVRCRVCDAVMFVSSPQYPRPGLGTWHGDVEFEVLDGEESRSIIAQQPKLRLRCLLAYLVLVAVASVCMRFLIVFYVHSIIAVIGIVVLILVLIARQPKPKSMV